MYWQGKDAVRTRFDVIRTIASVVTAVCLFALTIGFFAAGAYTVNTVSQLQSTYHPERLGSIISDASDTMKTIHQTTTMLKSSRGDVDLLKEFHEMIVTVKDLASSLKELHAEQFLQESSSWRDMSEHFINGLKHTLIDESKN